MTRTYLRPVRQIRTRRPTMPAYSIITPAAAPIVSTAEAKKQIEIAQSISYHDDYIDGLVSAATHELSALTGRSFATETREYLYQGFPLDGFIPIPHPPMRAVNSIEWLDLEGDWQVLDPAEYRTVTSYQNFGQVRRSPNITWPAEIDLVGPSVKINVDCGYGAPSEVPEHVKQAIKMRIYYWFIYRDGSANDNLRRLHFDMKWSRNAWDSLVSTIKAGLSYKAFDRLNHVW